VSNINVRVQNLLKSSLSTNQAEQRSKTLAGLILAEWSAIARNTLKSTRRAYLQSLQIRDVSASGFVVGLPNSPQSSVLAHLVERGMGPSGVGSYGPYDVRRVLLRASTRNIRTDKKGRLYLNVPFSHTKKTATAGFHRSGVERAMQRLAVTTTTAAKKTQWGGRLGAGYKGRAAPHHVADPLAGMVRQGSTYTNKQGKLRTQTSGYKTWRRASWGNTDPRAWMSSGVRPRNLMAEVVRALPTLIKQVF